MAKSKKKSEEELERRRIARRQKYQQIKNNPELYAAEQAKKRQNYLKRKEDNKIKSIKDMSPREQRVQRRKWKESAKKYYKKKVSQRIVQTVTVSDVSTDEALNVIAKEDPLNLEQTKQKPNISNIERKLLKKIRTIRLQHKKEKQTYISLINRYRNRIKYLQNKIIKLSNDANKQPTDAMYSEKDKNQLFKEILSNEITHRFATTKSRKEKRIITNLIDRKRFKAFKVSTELRKVCLRERFKKKVRDENINVQQLIQNFYEDDINSRITPGKKQYKKRHGIVKQTRYLLDTMKNLHKKFLKENTNIKVSYTTFTRLRPFWVSLPVDDRDTCACTLHTNFDLLISALNQNNIIHNKDSLNLLTELCCDKYNLDCVSRKCSNCKGRTILYKEFQNNQEIKYQEWERDTKKLERKEIKIIKKKTKQTNPRNLILKLEEMLPKFLVHTSNIINQYETIKNLKQSLNENESLIHMDFSENYAYKFSEEVQSMHFGGSRGQVSLHTAVVYMKNNMRAIETYSLCSASECTRHDAAAVWAHLNHLLKFVFDKSPQIDRIHILTDGPSSQYRNKSIFYILTQLKNDFPQLNLVTWNYQEAGHGKGAPDGIGAVVKRTADFQIKCQQDVGTFATFIDVIRKNVKNVKIVIVEEHEIKAKDIMLPKNIATFKGTMSVHQVVWASDSAYLEFRKQSCFECLVNACVHDKHMKFFKVYKTPIESSIGNVSVISENKKIRILSDITISHGNQQDKPSTSLLNVNATNKLLTTSLRSVRRDWTNKSFVGTHTKASEHEKEFLKFISNKDSNGSDNLSD